jgi:hypothetical protein
MAVKKLCTMILHECVAREILSAAPSSRARLEIDYLEERLIAFEI